MDRIAKLLQDAASIFTKLACEIENENKRVEDRLCAIEADTAKNRQVLKDVAHTILNNLD